ncbi:DAK2 domain-containing protein [Enterococcus faecalis]
MFAEHTKELFARKGRASYIGARSLEYIDLGAMSCRYLFEAFIEAGVFI